MVGQDRWREYYDYDPFSSTRKHWGRGWRERAVEAVVLQYRDRIGSQMQSITQRSTVGPSAEVASFYAIRNVMMSRESNRRADILLIHPNRHLVIVGDAKRAGAGDLDQRAVDQVLAYSNLIGFWRTADLELYREFAARNERQAVDTAWKRVDDIAAATGGRLLDRGSRHDETLPLVMRQAFIAVDGKPGEHGKLEESIANHNAARGSAIPLALVLVQIGRSEADRGINAITLPGYADAK